ncbi:MAG: hypothetical protein JETT_2665 [Candidatus Jettenia ecosi]|uniref:Uncharacterized protein n=1 Tax=Candidatus Jettenia ecosi TaxID=2494326 RepID=A0A533Q8T5_9BACT|nr:MAG: hypothetical protein JETT_2665 [Candidatus Jettenia ecosi]
MPFLLLPHAGIPDKLVPVKLVLMEMGNWEAFWNGMEDYRRFKPTPLLLS